MLVWRIAIKSPGYLAEDISGTGAKISGGRWNWPGLPVVYCADTQSLCCLETLVHIGTGGLPLSRRLIQVNIPDPIWRTRKIHTVATLPTGWDANPADRSSKDFGTQWLKDMESAVMAVPSVISPADFVVLLNPLHPDATAITANDLDAWKYDLRLFKTVPGSPS